MCRLNYVQRLHIQKKGHSFLLNIMPKLLLPLNLTKNVGVTTAIISAAAAAKTEILYYLLQ